MNTEQVYVTKQSKLYFFVFDVSEMLRSTSVNNISRDC